LDSLYITLRPPLVWEPGQVLPAIPLEAHPQSPGTTQMVFYQRMQTTYACMPITVYSTKKDQDEATPHPDAQSILD